MIGGYAIGKYVLDKKGYLYSVKLNSACAVFTLILALLCNSFTYFTYIWFLTAFLFGINLFFKTYIQI